MVDLLDSLPPPEATLVKSDPSGKIRSYQRGDDLIDVIQKGESNFHLLKDQEKVGQIIGIAPQAGWLFKGFSLLGKYERKEDQYRVTPYEQGKPVTEREETIHPLDYLLRFL
ncbi:MAG: hypothetical protein WCV90_08780 [Candidatus Woesearchaeota archaeon]|jgi:hypothetical protein